MNKNVIQAGWMSYYSIIKGLEEERKRRDLKFRHLGKGDFDHSHYKIPPIANEILQSSLKANYLPYAHPAGKTDTRELIARVENLRIGHDHYYNSENITQTIGATQAFYAVIKCILNNDPGEIITFEPTYISHTEVISSLGGGNFLINLDSGDDFLITQKNIELIREKLKNNNNVKAIVLVNPNFPIGKYVQKDVIKQILEICEQHDIYLVIDEAYSSNLINNEKSLDDVFCEYSEKLIKIHTFSKKLTLSGFRIGYILSSSDVAYKLGTLNEYMIGNPPTWTDPLIDLFSISQIESLSGVEPVKIIEEVDYDNLKRSIIEPYLNRTEMLQKESDQISRMLSKELEGVIDQLETSERIGYIKPDAGINMGISIKSDKDDISLMKEIYLNTGVVLTPGSVFSVIEADPWFRVTIASNPEHLHEGLHDLITYLEKEK